MFKVIEIAGLIMSLFRDDDDSKLNLSTKLLILALVSSYTITGYVILEYRTAYERGLDHKYKNIHLEAQIELLNKELTVLKERVGRPEGDSVEPVVPSKPSYEHPVPTTPNPPKRRPPEAILRERAEALMEKINN